MKKIFALIFLLPSLALAQKITDQQIDTTKVQKRITGTCGANAITSVAENGTVSCSTILSGSYLPLAGGTLTGALIAPKLGLQRTSNVASGISWFNSTWNTWLDYMGPAGTAGQGYAGTLTPPSGSYVTTWALRSVIESGAGYGWTWESNTSSGTTPAIVAELSSNNGTFRTTGPIYGTSFNGAGTGLTGTASSLTAGNATTAGSATTASNLTGAMYGTTGQIYTSHVQVREANLGGAQGSALTAAPHLAFHWGGVVASQLRLDADGGFSFVDNPGTGLSTVRAGAFSASGNLVLHAGNYNSYAPTLTGTGASGTWGINITGTAAGLPGITTANLFRYEGFTLDANTMPVNRSGFTYTVNAPFTGPITHFDASGYGLQFNAPYSSGNAIAFRTRNGDSGAWNNWYGLLTSANYTTYCPSLGGGGATGLWGINISGTAALASNSTNLYVTDDNTSNGTYALTWVATGAGYRAFSASSSKLTFNPSTGSLVAAGNITAYSDARIKENVLTISGALEKVLKLRGVSYTRKDDPTKEKQLGVVAQEVEKVLPELVKVSRNPNASVPDMKSVAYGNLTAVLIEAIKEQQAQIELLKSEVAVLKAKQVR